MPQRLGRIQIQRTILDFEQVRKQAGLMLRTVADIAGVPLREAYLFEIGALVSRETMHKLVKALSQLTGNVYTLQDFGIGELGSSLTSPESHPGRSSIP